MKKYVKPDLYYENFELSEHIATCAWDMSDQTDKNSCTAVSDEEYVRLSGLVLFVESTTSCALKADTQYEDYCWTNGQTNMNVFNS